LEELCASANSANMNLRMAKRAPGAAAIVPSVVHWKSGHYAAVLEKKGDLLKLSDPTQARPFNITLAALDDEGSGYYLVPAGQLPKGWEPVDGREGRNIWGKGLTEKFDLSRLRMNDKKTGPCPDK